MNKNRVLTGIATAIFLSFLTFWVVIAAKGLQGETDSAELFSALYGLMALFGGIVGLKASKKWGGYKSAIGRSALFMSLGLLAQEAGQITYSAYTYLFNQEIPYPSLGDIGFFGSVILYILAALSLVKALKTKAATGSAKNKAWVVAVPAALLVLSYAVFLRGHEADFDQPIAVFLDFGYPLGQALYVSLVALAFILSRRYLGGIMKPIILFLLFALLIQYVADFTFLYQVSRDTWVTGGVNELVYLTAYFVMTLALIKFGAAADRLSAGKRSAQ